MKKVIILLLFILQATGCESDNLKNENKKLTDQLNEANKQLEGMSKLKVELAAVQSKLKKTEEDRAATESKNKQNKIDLEWYQRVAGEISSIKNFQYEVISDSINRKPNDTVVFVKNVPNGINEQSIYLIRAAIDFSYDKYNIVSFWRDRDKAVSYADGNYNPEEGPLGWSGFDFRFGVLRNKDQNPVLMQYNSRDDGQAIDFGKFTSRP
jgi:hypothetical protein